MALFNTLRAQLGERLHDVATPLFDSLDLTTTASEYALRLTPHMDNLAMLGSDFMYGRGRVHMLPNHTWDEYEYAATCVGTANLEQLCASAGAVNIGIYGNKLVLKHAWQVRLVSCAILAISTLDWYQVLTHFVRLSQGMELSAHNCYTDTAIVMHPSRLHDTGRLSDTAADLMLLLANINYVLGITPQSVRQWALDAVRRCPITNASAYYHDVVPVGSVRWYLPRANEERIEQFGCFERLDQQATADVVSLHHLISEHSYPEPESPTSPVYTPSSSPSFEDWGSDVESEQTRQSIAQW